MTNLAELVKAFAGYDGPEVVGKIRTHQPKGSMCASCVDSGKDCSGLHFEQMRTIERDERTGVRIVKCTSHRKKEPA